MTKGKFYYLVNLLYLLVKTGNRNENCFHTLPSNITIRKKSVIYRFKKIYFKNQLCSLF